MDYKILSFICSMYNCKETWKTEEPCFWGSLFKVSDEM